MIAADTAGYTDYTLRDLGPADPEPVAPAAVIGGVSLAGGSGSVGGTVLGALIIQSIDSGLLLTDVGLPGQMNGRQVAVMAQHVADRLDLRRDIQFDTRVTSAVFDEATRLWAVVSFWMRSSG